MFTKEFKQAVNNTWQAIGSDALESLSYCDESPDNETCVEMCLDADRIVAYGGEYGAGAQQEFRAAMTQLGYQKALKAACNALQYPLV